jgi:uncharacterized protein YggT (Ycf19 family)
MGGGGHRPAALPARLPPAVDFLFKTLTLLRLIAFMVLLYLGLGWLVERYSTRPDSKLKGFFRLLGSPIVRPIARVMPPGTRETRVLAVSLAIVGCIWIALFLATEALAERG